MKLIQIILILSLCSYSFGFLYHILDYFGFFDYDDDDEPKKEPVNYVYYQPAPEPLPPPPPITTTTPEPVGPDISGWSAVSFDVFLM